MKFDIEYIEKIAKIISENSLSEITLDDGEKAISVKKELFNTSQAVQIPPAAPYVSMGNTGLSALKEEKTVSDSKANNNAITSPMVGAFYASPAPGAKPFVKVGDTVTAGQVVCIIEAMKLMNEIESEVSGKVTQICVEDGQSVEYGQVLMYVE